MILNHSIKVTNDTKSISVSEINREIGGDLIRTLKANAVGNTQFDKSAPAGVSFFEHKEVCAA